MPRHVRKDGSFIAGVKVKGYKTSEYLIRRIVTDHKVNETLVREILQYNIITVTNLALVTGLTTNNIHSKARGYLRGNNQMHYPLNTCDPFNDLFMKFIYRNAKCQTLIEDSVGYTRDMANYIDAETELKDDKSE